jgi:hypothetical protein
MQASNRRAGLSQPPSLCDVDTVLSPRGHGDTEKFTEKDWEEFPWELPAVQRDRIGNRRTRRRGRPRRPAASRRAVLGACGVALAALLLLRAAPAVFRRSVAPSPRRPVAPSLTGPAPFTIVTHGDTSSVELSAALRQTVRRRWPGYRLPPAASIPGEALEELRQERPEARVPYAVAADFNGDRRADAALLLRRGRRALLVALHGTPDGRFEGRRLLRTRWSDGLFVTRQPPGPLEYNRYEGGNPAGAAALALPADGIRFNAVDSAAQLYYFQEGAYRHVELGE